MACRNYFENSFHDENHLLLPVERFPTQFRGVNVEELKDEIVKKVKTFYDDHDAKRTISVVNHVNGVTELEFYYTDISYSNPFTTVASVKILPTMKILLKI